MNCDYAIQCYVSKTLNAVLNGTLKELGVIISSNRFIYYTLNIISIYDWSLTICLAIQAMGISAPGLPLSHFFPWREPPAGNLVFLNRISSLCLDSALIIGLVVGCLAVVLVGTVLVVVFKKKIR